jgi:hypothetical protein
VIHRVYSEFDRKVLQEVPEDKRVKGRQRDEDTPVVQTQDFAGAKARGRSIRLYVGDRISFELSPYDLSRGRITYRYAPPPDDTIEGSQPEVVIEDTFDELYTSVSECVAAVTQAHEQIEKNRPEIEALGRETRRLLSELKAA